MSKSFRELDVWKKSVDLTVLIYELTAEFPKGEIYTMTAQMRRGAISIASNIAEGSARRTRKDFRQFVKEAAGSNSELQTQLILAQRLKLGDCKKALAAEEVSIRIGMMLSRLASYLGREMEDNRSSATHDGTTNNQLRTTGNRSRR